MKELGPTAFFAVADGESAGLVIGSVRRARHLAEIVAARHPGLQVVLTVGGAAEVAGTDIDHAVGQAEALEDTLLYPDHLLVYVIGLLRGGEREHLDLGELVDPVEAAAGATVGASLRAEAVGETGVAQGKVSLLDYLVCVLACQSYLCGRYQREVRVFDGVDLGLRPARDETRPDQHPIPRQIRCYGRQVTALHYDVQRVADQAQLQQHGVAAQKVELAPRGLRPGIEVDDTEGFAKLDVVLRLEGKVRNLAPMPDLEVLRIILAEGRVGLGHVRDLQLLLPQPLLDLVELVLFGGEPLFHGPRLLDEPGPRLLAALPAAVPGHPVMAF